MISSLSICALLTGIFSARLEIVFEILKLHSKKRNFFYVSQTILTILLIFCFASVASAQDDDYHAFELSVGYTHPITDGIIGDGEISADENDALDLGDDSSLYPSPVDISSAEKSLLPAARSLITGGVGESCVTCPVRVRVSM